MPSTAARIDQFLDGKAVLEAGGWRLPYGTVDSFWVTPASEVADAEWRELEAFGWLESGSS